MSGPKFPAIFPKFPDEKMDYRFQFNFETGDLTVNSIPLYIKEGTEDGFGTGSSVWDCGVVLVKYLDSKEFEEGFWKRKKVLELGSGTGIVGLGVALLGAQVILTDEPPLLPRLHDNVQRNSKQVQYPPRVQKLDWTEETPDLGQLDFILCSDLIYHEKSIDPFIRTLKGLASKETTVLMAHKHRSDQVDDVFFGQLQQHFDIEEISLERFHPEFRNERIYIFTMRLLS